MDEQDRGSKRNHVRPVIQNPSKFVGCLIGLCTLGVLLTSTNSFAERVVTAEEISRINRLNAARLSFDIGTALKVPTQPVTAEADRLPVISCRMICSAFEPRQALAEIAWPEQGKVAAVEEESLRLDIIGAASRFVDGNFGTVRLSAVPIAVSPDGGGVDLNSIRKRIQPAMIQRVENHRIIARDPALPGPEALKLERLPEGRKQLPPAAREAIERDAQLGAFGRMQVVAQSVEVRRAIPHRNLVLEGLQPGLSYRVRLVEEAAASAETLAENFCRVPVCPADFVETP